jgi:hypothetical protein
VNLYSEQGQGSTESKIVLQGRVMVPFGLLLADGWAALAHLQTVRTSLVCRGLVPPSVGGLVSHVWNVVFHVKRVKSIERLNDM